MGDLLQFLIKKRWDLSSFLLILIVALYIFLPALNLSNATLEQRGFYQDNRGQTYLYGYDSYYYYSLSQEMLEKDNFISADSLHVTLIVASHKLTSSFFDVDLIKSMFYYSLSLILLAILLMYLFLRNIFDKSLAFAGTIFFIVIMGFSRRILVGFVDTDIYNLIFPLILFWMSWQSVITNKKVYPLLGGLFIGFYSLTWKGWWLTFYLILSGFLIMLIIAIYKKEVKKEIKNLLINIFLFCFTSTVAVILFSGYSVLKNALFFPIPKAYSKLTYLFNFYSLLAVFVIVVVLFLLFRRWQDKITVVMSAVRNKLIVQSLLFTIVVLLIIIITNLNLSAEFTIWPNFFLSINELQPNSFLSLYSLVGGFFFSTLILLGFVSFFYQRLKAGLFFRLVVVSWLLFSLSATSHYYRFVLLMLIPLTICFTQGIKSVNYQLGKYSRFYFGKKKFNWVIILVFVIIFFQVNNLHHHISSARPVVNDDWMQASEFIKSNSSEDSLIITWWDYGYFVEALASRQVAFHGGSQNSITGFWMSRALTSTDAKLSKGIFRMLSCSNDKHLTKISSFVGQSAEKIRLLEKIVLLDRNKAEVFLQKSYPGHKYLLELTHCNQSREIYLLLLEEMLFDQNVFQAAGWDYQKAEIYLKIKDLGEQDAVKYLKALNLVENEARKTYQIVSSSNFKDFVSDTVKFNAVSRCASYTGGLVCGKFGINYRFDTEDNGTISLNYDGQAFKPHFFSGELDGIYVEQELTEYDLDQALFLLKSNEFLATLSNSKLFGSLFSKLYSSSNWGEIGFKKVYPQGKINGGIILYKLT